jgi:hypothetical protein
MKAKHILLILAAGILIGLVGAIFKIQHWPGALTMLIVATTLQVISGLLLLYKLLTHPKVKEFLNW